MLSNILLTVIAVLVIAILLGSIYSLFAAIFFFIFSGGDEERKKKGFNSLRYMIIGLLVTGVLLFLVPYVFTLLYLPGAELFNVSNVLVRMREILSYVFHFGGMWGDYIKDTTVIGGGGIDGGYGEYQL